MNLDYNETAFTRVEDVKIPDSFYNKLKTNNPVLDDLFSGGLTPGSSFTITGPYGSGKSTFCLQLLELLAKQGYNVGVCSSEEIIHQVAYTCHRLNVKNIQIANISNVDRVAAALKEFDIIVVDSFQGLTHPNYEGKVRAIEKYAIETLYAAAKENETVLGCVCHITKNGQLKGGTIVPHTVDMNMMIEKSDDEDDRFTRKVIITKNRFGSCNEIECQIQATGYDFTNALVSNTQIDDIQNAQEQAEHSEIYSSVLELKDNISLMTVTQLLNGDTNKAYFILKEMVNNNTLTVESTETTTIYKITENIS